MSRYNKDEPMFGFETKEQEHLARNICHKLLEELEMEINLLIPKKSADIELPPMYEYWMDRLEANMLCIIRQSVSFNTKVTNSTVQPET